MYFPNDNTKLEVLPRENFTSLGNTPAFLLMAKNACGLPADPSWTEMDETIKMYIDAAEEFIDSLAVFPYRPRSFTLWLSPTTLASNSAGVGVSMCGRRFSAIRLPKAPVLAEDCEVSFLESDDEDYTVFSTWKLVGSYSLTPEIVFNRDVSLPTVNQPYPAKVTFTTAADEENVIQKMAILTLTDHYFKNPEAMVTKNTTGIPGMFWDCLNRLGAGGYS